MTKYLIGVDLGGTKILTGLATPAGTILHSTSFPTHAEAGRASVINQILQGIEGLMTTNRIPKSNIMAIGIGAPGPVNQSEGMIINPPNLTGWKKVPLKSIVEKQFAVPTYLENDANATALGEWRFGAGQGSRSMVYITISTGIGAGIIIDGKPYGGHNGMAGEIGHTIIDPHGPLCGCGKRGCLEAFSSGLSLAKIAREAVKKKASRILKLADNNPLKITAEMVEQAAKDGDKLAQQLIADCLEAFAIGISNLNNILNPDRIVIGGGMAKMGRMMFQPLQKRVNELSFAPVKIVPAHYGRLAGLMGAFALCIRDN